MPHYSAPHEDTLLALAYKRALDPVLNTVLQIIGADALFLWELFDSPERIEKLKSRRAQLDAREKRRLCGLFYDFLRDRRHTSPQSLTNEIISDPSSMHDYLKEQYSILKFVRVVSNPQYLSPILFDFGEEKRPRKYVVLDPSATNLLPQREIAPPDAHGASREPITCVVAEGITAYHARTKTTGNYTRDQLLRMLGTLNIDLNHDLIQIRRHPSGDSVDHCDHLCLLPIVKDGEVIAILKAENYDPSRPFSQEAIAAAEDMLPFLADFILNSRAGVRALTYPSLCKGEALLQSLIDLKDDADKGVIDLDQSIVPVLKSLIHLFQVFQRGTYIGWSEIAGRINHFIQEIRETLHLPTTDLLERFDNFQKYDELLLTDVIQYREHFIHQFHTFVLGLILILRVGIKKFVSWSQRQLQVRREIFGEHCADLDQEAIMRIWFYASFYHDYAYILQKFDEGMSTFVKKVLNLDRFGIRNDWSQVFLDRRLGNHQQRPMHSQKFSDYLIEMASYFVSGDCDPQNLPAVRTQAIRLVDQIWESVITRQEHGPLSAFVLLDSLLSQPGCSLQSRNEAFLAALAIACHHEEVFGTVVTTHDEPFLTLEGMPFLFLLVYCDTAQEWGRRKLERDITPRLDSVALREGGDGVTELVVSIWYDADTTDSVPPRDVIISAVGRKTDRFKSRTYRFIVEYFSSRGGSRGPGAVKFMTLVFERASCGPRQ